MPKATIRGLSNVIASPFSSANSDRKIASLIGPSKVVLETKRSFYYSIEPVQILSVSSTDENVMRPWEMLA